MALCDASADDGTYAGIPSEEPESIAGVATTGRASVAGQEHVSSNALTRGRQSN